MPEVSAANHRIPSFRLQSGRAPDVLNVLSDMPFAKWVVYTLHAEHRTVQFCCII